MTKKITRLGAALAAACALMWVNTAGADLVDCKTCHLTHDPTSPAPDFTAYYNNPGHHSVGVSYPAIASDPFFRYNAPTGQVSGIVFFDANHNGVVDPGEIQLFGSPGSATVECSSCHIEHGTVLPPPGTPPSLYLRINNSSSNLCYVCHQL